MVYKVVPGPMIVEGNPQEASKKFEDLINANAVDGWKYHSLETITSEEMVKAGCMKPATPVRTQLYMLIFAKE